MDLLPDVGTWLLRSVRRAPNGTDNPISVVERLNSLPHPLRNADKDTLVGAVLSLGPSLQLALHMLMELLPEDESRGRLGEVLCPTLGHLQRSLEETLSYLEPKRLLTDQQLPARSRTPVPRSEIATSIAQSKGEGTSSSISEPAARKTQSASTCTSAVSQDKASSRPVQPQPTIIKTPAPRQPTPPRIHDDQDTTITNNLNFPVLQQPNRDLIPPPPSVSQYSDAKSHLQPEQPNTPHARPSTPNRNPSKSRSRSRSRYSAASPPRQKNPAADLALMKELRAEMRVNAAIQVAVDSLEFADGQMKIVRDVHRLHGSGSFELLQKHFYEGYNRILFRALELEQREFDSPSNSPLASPRQEREHGRSRWEDEEGGLETGQRGGHMQADDGDEGYEGSGGLVSSPTKITASGSEGSERSGHGHGSSPFRHQIQGTPGPNHLQVTSQSTPGAPNVTPEHINTSYHAHHGHQQAAPPLILFNNHQTEPISLPPLPPIHSLAGSSSPTSRRPATANPVQTGNSGGVSGGMRTRWDDAALNGGPSALRNGRPLARRNTVQGQSNGWSGGNAGGGNTTSTNDRLDANTGGSIGIPPRPRGSLKRRLSLAEELALVGEDSDEEEEEEEEDQDEGDDDQDGGVNNKNSQSSSDSESEDQSKESSSEEEYDNEDDESDDDESESDVGEQPAKPAVTTKTLAPAPVVSSPAVTATAPRSIPRAPTTTTSQTVTGTSPLTGSEIEARRRSIGLQGASRLPRPQSSMSRPGTPLGRPQTPLGRPQTPSILRR